MLIEQFVEIKIYKNSKNKNYYRSKGYKITDETDKIIVKTSDLQQSSTIKVKVTCDVCKKENLIEYRHFLKNIKKYGFYSCHGKCSRLKFKKTNLYRYDVENPAQLKETQEKMKITNIERYGVENVFQNENIKEISKNTKKERYNDEYFTNREKCKHTCIEIYGVEHPMQNEIVFNKNERKCFSLNWHKETGLYYRSSYEKDFLDFCVEKKLKVSKGKRIQYTIDNKKHYYFSDFYLSEKNLILEIKCDWTYKKDLIKNEIKKRFTLLSGYNFLFLIDKNYTELLKYIL